MRSQAILLGAAALSAGATLLGTARAGQPIDISGKDTCKITEAHALPVEGDQDHVLIVQKGTCTRSASGQSSRFDGSQINWVETDDLVKGSGTLHGYLIERLKDGGTEQCRYTGLMTTVMVNGKQNTTRNGTWEMIRGTGPSLANVQMRGIFKFTPTSDTGGVSDWQGTLTEEAPAPPPHA